MDNMLLESYLVTIKCDTIEAVLTSKLCRDVHIATNQRLAKNVNHDNFVLWIEINFVNQGQGITRRWIVLSSGLENRIFLNLETRIYLKSIKRQEGHFTLQFHFVHFLEVGVSNRRRCDNMVEETSPGRHFNSCEERLLRFEAIDQTTDVSLDKLSSTLLLEAFSYILR